MLEIMTERCCLRPMTDADFPALCRYLQDPGVMYAYGHAFSDREVWDWLRRQQARYVVPGYGALAVELRETGGNDRPVRHHHAGLCGGDGLYRCG